MKNSFIIRILVVGAIMVLTAACQHEVSVANGLVGTTAVEMKDYAFVPARIKVKKGQTVTWTNRDLAEHTVTINDAALKGPKSDYIDTQKAFSFTFDSLGTFDYHCEPHPYMKAMVEVLE